MKMKSIIKSSLLIEISIGLLILIDIVKSYSLIKDLRLNDSGQCELNGLVLEPGERQNHPDECLQVVCFRDGSGRAKVNYCPWDPDAEYLDTSLPYPKCCKLKESKSYSRFKGYNRTPESGTSRVEKKLQQQERQSKYDDNNVERSTRKPISTPLDDNEDLDQKIPATRPTYQVIQRTRQPTFRRPTSTPARINENEKDEDDSEKQIEISTTTKAPNTVKKIVFKRPTKPSVTTNEPETESNDDVNNNKPEITTKASVPVATTTKKFLPKRPTNPTIEVSEPETELKENSKENQLEITTEASEAPAPTTIKRVLLRRPTKPSVEVTDSDAEGNENVAENQPQVTTQLPAATTLKKVFVTKLRTTTPTSVNEETFTASETEVVTTEESRKPTSRPISSRRPRPVERTSEQAVTTESTTNLPTEEDDSNGQNRFKSRPTRAQGSRTFLPIITTTKSKRIEDENYPSWYKNSESAPPTLGTTELTILQPTESPEDDEIIGGITDRKIPPRFKFKTEDENEQEIITEPTIVNDANNLNAIDSVIHIPVTVISDEVATSEIQLNLSNNEANNSTQLISTSINENNSNADLNVVDEKQNKIQTASEIDVAEEATTIKSVESSRLSKKLDISESIPESNYNSDISTIINLDGESITLTNFASLPNEISKQSEVSDSQQKINVNSDILTTANSAVESNELNPETVSKEKETVIGEKQLIVSKEKVTGNSENEKSNENGTEIVFSENVSTNENFSAANTEDENEAKNESSSAVESQTPESSAVQTTSITNLEDDSVSKDNSKSETLSNETIQDVEHNLELASNDSAVKSGSSEESTINLESSQTQTDKSIEQKALKSITDLPTANSEKSVANFDIASESSVNTSSEQATETSTANNDLNLPQQILIPVQIITDEITSTQSVSDIENELIENFNDKLSKRENTQKKIPIITSADESKNDSVLNIEQQRDEPVFSIADLNEFQQRIEPQINIGVEYDGKQVEEDDGQQKLIDGFSDITDLDKIIEKESNSESKSHIINKTESEETHKNLIDSKQEIIIDNQSKNIEGKNAVSLNTEVVVGNEENTQQHILESNLRHPEVGKLSVGKQTKDLENSNKNVVLQGVVSNENSQGTQQQILNSDLDIKELKKLSDALRTQEKQSLGSAREAKSDSSFSTGISSSSIQKTSSNGGLMQDSENHLIVNDAIANRPGEKISTSASAGTSDSAVHLSMSNETVDDTQQQILSSDLDIKELQKLSDGLQTQEKQILESAREAKSDSSFSTGISSSSIKETSSNGGLMQDSENHLIVNDAIANRSGEKISTSASAGNSDSAVHLSISNESVDDTQQQILSSDLDIKEFQKLSDELHTQEKQTLESTSESKSGSSFGTGNTDSSIQGSSSSGIIIQSTDSHSIITDGIANQTEMNVSGGKISTDSISTRNSNAGVHTSNENLDKKQILNGTLNIKEILKLSDDLRNPEKHTSSGSATQSSENHLTNVIGNQSGGKISITTVAGNPDLIVHTTVSNEIVDNTQQNNLNSDLNIKDLLKLSEQLRNPEKHILASTRDSKSDGTFSVDGAISSVQENSSSGSIMKSSDNHLTKGEDKKGIKNFDEILTVSLTGNSDSVVHSAISNENSDSTQQHILNSDIKELQQLSEALQTHEKEVLSSEQSDNKVPYSENKNTEQKIVEIGFNSNAGGKLQHDTTKSEMKTTQNNGQIDSSEIKSQEHITSGSILNEGVVENQSKTENTESQVISGENYGSTQPTINLYGSASIDSTKEQTIGFGSSIDTQQKTLQDDAELSQLVKDLDSNKQNTLTQQRTLSGNNFGDSIDTQQKTLGEDAELKQLLKDLEVNKKEIITQQRTLADDDLNNLVKALQTEGADDVQQRSLRNDNEPQSSIEPIYFREPGRYRILHGDTLNFSQQ